jgi:hypothetical protein
VRPRRWFPEVATSLSWGVSACACATASGDTARNVHFESITAFDAVVNTFERPSPPVRGAGAPLGREGRCAEGARLLRAGARPERLRAPDPGQDRASGRSCSPTRSGRRRRCLRASGRRGNSRPEVCGSASGAGALERVPREQVRMQEQADQIERISISTASAASRPDHDYAASGVGAVELRWNLGG